jgi:hypothetical protein
MRKAESDYMGRVAELPCAICGDTPVEVHHLREGVGMAQRNSNYVTVPLCPGCHRGPHGVHGDKLLLRARKLTEMDLLASTIEALNE